MIDIGKGCKIDLNKLISTRLLIQANSGGGKSWLIRKILEQSHGKVQQIVIDLEGEFSTLREKYDYLLVGQGGEIQANIKTSEILAKKILELNVSTIIDLSELKHHERILFVKRFIDSLINAPKKLWHPCMVIVDEADQFCPEKAKSESASSIIDLMCRGRKRGFCGILATQRISKLHKDACAEANNKLIGRTGLDIDRKRASDELGFTSKEQERSLRNLNAGSFYAFGPAISTEIISVEIGSVKTTHPEAGKNILIPSKTPANIKKILKDVIDLPKEAEEELKTKGDMKKKINDLKREVRILEKSRPKPKPIVDEKSLQIAFNKGVKESEKQLSVQIKELNNNIRIYDSVLKRLNDILINFNKKQPTKVEPLPIKTHSFKPLVKDKPETNIDSEVIDSNLLQNEVINSDLLQNDSEVKPVKLGAMKILGWLVASYPDSISKPRIATLSGFSMKGGTFGSYISTLRKNGWIIVEDELTATEEGCEQITQTPEIPTGDELIEMWASKFKLGVGKILRLLCEAYPNSLSKEELGELSGFESSGGTFGSYISKLRKNNLIIIEGGMITASAEFFE